MATSNKWNRTTIQLTKETKNKLESFKVVPGQSYDDVLEFLMRKKIEELQKAKKLLAIDGVSTIYTPDSGYRFRAEV